MSEILQTVADTIAETIEADRVSLLNFDLENQRILYFIKAGPGKERIDTSVGFDELSHGLSGWVLKTGEPALSLKDQEDPRESPEARKRRVLTECGSILVAPLRHGNTNIGTITAINEKEHRDFTQIDVEILLIISNYCAMLIENVQMNMELISKNRLLEEISEHDTLTGLYNRRVISSRVDEIWRHCKREKLEMSVLIIDIDHFKEYNDTLGHSKGDECLKNVAQILKNTVHRPGDMVIRFGGDEFIMILPYTSLDNANHIAEGIRTNVEDTHVLIDSHHQVKVTVSIGIASLVPTNNFEFENLLNVADEALYESKNQGRNRINSKKIAL